MTITSIQHLVGTASLELRKYTDRLGRVTTYNYDADRRLTSVVDPTTSTTTRTTSYSYYEDGTLKEITDANGNVTHYDIDIESPHHRQDIRLRHRQRPDRDLYMGDERQPSLFHHGRAGAG